MICEIADNYFNSLSPLAARICEDIRRVRAAYEDLWQNFSPEQQDQIINENIIHPQVLLKYSLTASSLSGKGGCRYTSGTKQVFDENLGVSWRDEYSAPFSWKCQSQMDLCQSKRCVSELTQSAPIALQVTEISNEVLVPPENDTCDAAQVPTPTFGAFSDFCSRLRFLPGKSKDYQVSGGAAGDGGLLTKLKTNTVYKLQSTLRMVSGKVGSRQSGDGEMLVIGGSAVIVSKAQKCSPKKPTSPPPPPPPPTRILLQKDVAETPLLSPCTPILYEANDHSQLEQVEEHNSESQSIDSFNMPDAPSLFGSTKSVDSFVPKTGFDFLDNW